MGKKVLPFVPTRITAQVQAGDEEGFAVVPPELIGQKLNVRIAGFNYAAPMKENFARRKKLRELRQREIGFIEEGVVVVRRHKKGEGTISLPQDWIGFGIIASPVAEPFPFPNF